VPIDIPHGCGRTHHCWQSLAECRWPEAAFVTGDGPFALVARCDMVSVALYETAHEAARRWKRMDTVGCGRGCDHRHEVVELDQAASASAR
jgi:hypothetical protein